MPNSTHPVLTSAVRWTLVGAATCLLAQPSGHAHPGLEGRLVMGGDSTLDARSLGLRSEPARRWLSAPGGRLCLNPSAAKTFHIAPPSEELSLELGAYAGARVIRLPRVLVVSLFDAGGNKISAPVEETWYPHRLAFQLGTGDGWRVRGRDFFPDAGPSLIRMIETRAEKGWRLRITGEEPASIDGHGTVIVTGVGYRHALAFARITEEGDAPEPLPIKPVLTDDGWTLEYPLAEGLNRLVVGFGFATDAEEESSAAARAVGALARPVEESENAALARMNGMLAKVPVPARFGFEGGPSASEHRQQYYMAWTFLLQSTLAPLPEHPDYPFPQMSLGKSALWAEGHPKCPATCGWESFLGIQWHALIDADFGWKAYEGILSLVDDAGRLGGESLPSRKAQTAWVLHRNHPDQHRLAAIYPALRRYLLWREKNPRWIYGDNIAPDEKDLEFVASWLVDVRFAGKIAAELGFDKDVEMWRRQSAAMIETSRGWFFRDPERIHQFYFTEKNLHTTPQRNEYRPIMILSALAIPGLPDDLRGRLSALSAEILDPKAPNAGFAYTKYPDNQFVAWGMIDQGMPEAAGFIRAILRDCLACGEFAETVEVAADGRLTPGGVKPSLFTALNIIEFTWLLNGVRFDNGVPEPCVVPGHSQQQ